MDTPRSVFKIDKNNPGSDVAAETAAALAAVETATALAAASFVFRRSDPSYSKLLLKTAIRDELLWGVAWLQKATKNLAYLNYIQAKGQTLGADETDNTFGWDNKHVGPRIPLSLKPNTPQVVFYQDE